METRLLGRSGLVVSCSGFGALPIQRVAVDEAIPILRRAYDGGMTLFDTARNYTDSEEKLGRALADVRANIVIATKSMAPTPEKLQEQLEHSLKALRTDYIDLYQFHFSRRVPKPDDGSGMYEVMLRAKEEGKIRSIGLTSHALPVALEAAASGLYDAVQYPLSLLSAERDLELIDVCREHNVGLLAMKGLGGGLISHIPAAFAFLRRYDNLVPLWGVEKMSELEDFLALEAAPLQWTEELEQAVAREREALQGNFCRGCGYCLPCPAKIDLPTVARMGLSSRRLPRETFASDEWREKARSVDDCIDCGKCATRCPYEIKTFQLIREQAAMYWETMRGLGL